METLEVETVEMLVSITCPGLTEQFIYVPTRNSLMLHFKEFMLHVIILYKSKQEPM